MSGPASRRGFLRGLTTLPLIGGGVALIGAPSAVAAPLTPGMMATYSAWLHFERRALMHASTGDGEGRFVPCINPGSHFHFREGHRYDPATWGRDAQLRAPLVLAAVGCPLTSAEAEDQWGSTFRCDWQRSRA